MQPSLRCLICLQHALCRSLCNSCADRLAGASCAAAAVTAALEGEGVLWGWWGAGDAVAQRAWGAALGCM
jgi:hypothetical protein